MKSYFPDSSSNKSTSIFVALFILLCAATAFAWPIPDTGQTKCYDNEKEIPCPKPGEPFYGQDGNYTINPPSYTKLDDRGRELPDSASAWAMVRDNVTGLIWEVKTDDGSIHDKDNQYEWKDAQSNFITRLNQDQFGGHADWRLPTREELRSIVDYGKYDPSINRRYFPNCVSSYYWSSTTYASSESNAWSIHFGYGYDNYDHKSSSRYVRAVLGGQGGSFGSWVIHNDGTATDKLTGLTWQTGEPGEMTWESALAYCEKLNLAGHSDWRLPTIKELASLAKLDSYKPAANKKIFPKIVSSYYWSSTTHASYEYYAWGIYFGNGDDYHGYKSYSRYVRAVLGGQAGSLDHLVISPQKPDPQTISPPAPDTTPPTIAITEPQIQRGVIRRKTNQIAIKGVASDPSGVHQVLVNGQKAQLQGNGHFQTVAFLRVGDNQIIVQATDTRNNTATETFSINRAPDAPISPPIQQAQPAAPTLKGWYASQHAVVVGINAYQNPDIPALRNAINDAKAVAQMFKDKMGFSVSELYGKSATRKAILRAIANVQQKAGPNDGFVFYFAGHGQGVQLKNKKMPEGYIIPFDASLDLSSAGAILFDEEAISLSRLRTYAQDFNARHVALILDSCFSGLAMRRTTPRFPPMTAAYYNDLLARKAINILTAGDDHPVSDGYGHSPFTQALLYALDRANIDLHDRDGFATFNQLAVYVKEKVEKATARRQRPQFDNMSMDDGEFVFWVRGQ